ncbi:hypothetical protein Pmani_019252 [Petrolisthes manimaculis]|uniref:Uncharacterized protein n=1 Tax=Petrolisthes manimaculis TaxID=1843537 RepID=A0AAE1U5W3_9EUCA|nr:hypothetical protein Pmani_019252 [Petrolisthes manimaculis]
MISVPSPPSQPITHLSTITTIPTPPPTLQPPRIHKRQRQPSPNSQPHRHHTISTTSRHPPPPTSNIHLQSHNIPHYQLPPPEPPTSLPKQPTSPLSHHPK